LTIQISYVDTHHFIRNARAFYFWSDLTIRFEFIESNFIYNWLLVWMVISSTDACFFSYVILVILCRFRNVTIWSLSVKVCNWIQLGDCQQQQLLIFGGGGGFGAGEVQVLS